MARIGSASVDLDEYEIEYLLELVEKDQEFGGAFIGTEVTSVLKVALRDAEGARDA